MQLSYKLAFPMQASSQLLGWVESPYNSVYCCLVIANALASTTRPICKHDYLGLYSDNIRVKWSLFLSLNFPEFKETTLGFPKSGQYYEVSCKLWAVPGTVHNQQTRFWEHKIKYFLRKRVVKFWDPTPTCSTMKCITL